MISDINQGDTRDIEVTVKDKDGSAFNLTGYTIKMYLKANIDDVAPLLDLTGSIVSAVEGRLSIPMTYTDTDQVVGSYHYWIVINISTTSIYTVARDTLKIIAGK